ncbi:hypothetical protein HPP92_010633 [Vanilla planifolia]|uniref:RING-type domain-containing protein n=1 Tax=Vanilla planifolia TaxID=51239 RepID=A0A835R5H8_VANPL|nr:hypothetical protein HPP92_010887 [Vanilla planifolia]KAG0482549.1 hypothetical protein HPP92_010633 [Vanilla planifolia]
MAEASSGPLVPSVKSESRLSQFPPLTLSVPAAAVSMSVTTEAAAVTTMGEELELDKDLLCPICMGMIKDAFLTACGHSFCYMCIVTHLQNKSDCPSCSQYLTKNLLYPNFLLNKLLKKASARQIAKTASPVDRLRVALQQKDCVISVKELDGLLSLLVRKNRRWSNRRLRLTCRFCLTFCIVSGNKS